MDALVTFIVLIAFIFGVAMLYKNRHAVSRWLNDTNLTVTDAKRKKFLIRRMEDDSEELKEIEERIEKGTAK